MLHDISKTTDGRSTVAKVQRRLKTGQQSRKTETGIMQ